MVRKGLLWVMRDRIFSRYHGKKKETILKKTNIFFPSPSHFFVFSVGHLNNRSTRIYSNFLFHFYFTERFCILTRNYLHCFKKGSEASLTQMGNFLFKVHKRNIAKHQRKRKRENPAERISGASGNVFKN